MRTGSLYIKTTFNGEVTSVIFVHYNSDGTILPSCGKSESTARANLVKEGWKQTTSLVLEEVSMTSKDHDGNIITTTRATNVQHNYEKVK